MNDDDIKKLGQELAQGIKTQSDCKQVLGKLLMSFWWSPKEPLQFLGYSGPPNSSASSIASS